MEIPDFVSSKLPGSPAVCLDGYFEDISFLCVPESQFVNLSTIAATDIPRSLNIYLERFTVDCLIVFYFLHNLLVSLSPFNPHSLTYAQEPSATLRDSPRGEGKDPPGGGEDPPEGAPPPRVRTLSLILDVDTR